MNKNKIFFKLALLIAASAFSVSCKTTTNGSDLQGRKEMEAVKIPGKFVVRCDDPNSEKGSYSDYSTHAVIRDPIVFFKTDDSLKLESYHAMFNKSPSHSGRKKIDLSGVPIDLIPRLKEFDKEHAFLPNGEYLSDTDHYNTHYSHNASLNHLKTVLPRENGLYHYSINGNQAAAWGYLLLPVKNIVEMPAGQEFEAFRWHPSAEKGQFDNFNRFFTCSKMR
jgi:hypothetical protein